MGNVKNSTIGYFLENYKINISKLLWVKCKADKICFIQQKIIVHQKSKI